MRGLLHVYYGGGKGKTSAGMGAVLRAAGHGWRAGVAQFLKPGNSGELAALARLGGVRIFPFLPGVKFTNAMSGAEREAARRFYDGLLDEIAGAAGELDLLLLDEAGSAVASGLLDEGRLTTFLAARPAGLEVVVTAHQAPAFLLDAADYVSEIRCVRHPYERGVSAREGIEW